jgi:hypothetical protein
VGSFSETNPPGGLFRWISVALGAQIEHVSLVFARDTNPRSGQVQRKSFLGMFMKNFMQLDPCTSKSLEVGFASVYGARSSLRYASLKHVGAGNAVKFGDSGAAVTGYETPSAILTEKAGR